MIKTIIKLLISQGKKVLILAPTNKASILIGGGTLHKFFFKFNNSKKRDLMLKSIDYIFCDEISLVKEVFYRYFHYIHDHPQINFIVAGDWNQLPPVCDISDFHYQDSIILKEVCKFNKVELTKCRRADDELFNLCKYVESIIYEEFPHNKTLLIYVITIV